MLDRSKMTRRPSHPGEVIRNLYMEPAKISVTALAGHIGVSRKTLSKIINEHGSITPDMALRLSRAFSTSPELWLNMQRSYDLWVAENVNTGWKDIEPVYVPETPETQAQA